MTGEALFEWDPRKAEANIAKHGISFEEAVLSFADPFALLELDRIVDGELRWKATGMVGVTTVIVVAHTIRDNEDREIIRIISARRAERHERKRYENEARPI